MHEATRALDKGLFPKSFCKLTPDILGGDADWVNVMHADGAGTKAILAYLYWRETGDLAVWEGVAQDAIVMNLDDLLCVGIYDNILFSSSIDRNKHLIPGDVLKALIDGSEKFFQQMKEHSVGIHYLGGETADVGDVVRTVAVNGTMTARWPRNRVVSNEGIAAGQVIVGLASFGQASYEVEYNSGIGSNGLTSARHDVLQKKYATEYPESFEPSLDNDVVYIGTYNMTDPVKIAYAGKQYDMHAGKLLLSPTRTFAPFVRVLFEENFDLVKGMVHCSGGGQTKCMKFMPAGVKVIKDNLFAPPEIFQIIQTCSGAPDKEMYQVFNMGCRLEIYTEQQGADTIIDAARAFGIEAQVIGRVEEAGENGLEVHAPGGVVHYNG